MPAWQAVGALASGNLASAMLSSDTQKDMSRENIKYQKQFAQHGIRWKVRDAQAAGVHPLFALGAQTHSFQPSYVGGADYTGIGTAAAAASNAARSYFEKDLRKQQVRNMELQNDLLSEQIAMSQVKRDMLSDNSSKTVPTSHLPAKERQRWEWEQARALMPSKDDPTRIAGPKQGEPVWTLLRPFKSAPALEFPTREWQETFENPFMLQLFWERNWGKLTIPLLKHFAENSPSGRASQGIARIMSLVRKKMRPAKTYQSISPYSP